MGKKRTTVPGTEVSPDAKRAKRYQVLLDPDIARKVAVIAGALDLSIPDWVNNRLRPIVERELPSVLKELGLANEK